MHIGLLSKVPVVTGELGEKDCTPNFINTYMTWADANGVSYLAWAFNAGPSWACNAPSLITDYSGNPTPYGAGYKAHLATL
jgi:endoglucanase